MTILGHNVIASNSVNNQVNIVNGGWISSMIKQYYNDGITFHTDTTMYSAGAVYPITATERMRITSGGNVGIGTTNPAQKLSVQGEIAKYCSFGGVDGNFENLIKYGFAANLQSGTSDANRWIGIDATVTAGSAVTNTLRIRAYSGGFGNAAPVNVADFRGDQSSYFYGNVGIGQNNPASRLSVSGDATNIEGLVNINNTKIAGGVYFPALKVRNGEGNHSYGIVSEFSTGSTGGDRASVLFYTSASNHSWTIGQVTSSWGVADSFGIGYRASNTPSSFSAWPSNYFAITTGGNVLVGTISDNGNKLRVNGTIFSDSSITATSFFESSDSRIKKLIENNLDYQSIANVTAKYYEKNGKQELGYFAQDFETLLPSAVSKNEDGYLNLSYREVHTAKIAYLEKRIEELEQQLKTKL
jgi:hypothetical protein